MLFRSYFILRLPRPIYFFFASFTLMGFLLDPLGFLGPITTSLLLITFWIYWPLNQLNEFTNSFLRLLWPIYFFFISFYSCGPVGHQSTGLASLFPYYFPLPTLSILLRFFCCWALRQKWASTLLYVNDQLVACKSYAKMDKLKT